MNVTTLRYSVRTIIGNYRQGLNLLKIYPRFADRIVTENTEICIEGFPRCANSYFLHLFKLRAPSIKRIAHHLHVPAQVLRAMDFNIPTVVLIRDPIEALSSALIVSNCELNASLAVKSYIWFYKKLLPYKDRCLVADFIQVTNNIEPILWELKERFGLPVDFSSIRDEEKMKVFDELKKINENKKHPKNLLAIPDTNKNIEKEKAKEIILCNKHIEQAFEIFNLWKNGF